MGRMNTIYYTANVTFYSFETGAGALFRSFSHEADEVHRKPGRLRRDDDPSAGGVANIFDGFVTLSEVVNKYLPHNTALTAEWN